MRDREKKSELVSVYEDELRAALARTRARCARITERCQRVAELPDEAPRRDSEPPPG